MLYKSNLLTLRTMGYIVGMCILYCLWAQVAVLDKYIAYWIVWDRYMQVLYLGRAPRTKETARFSKVASGDPTSTCVPRVDR